MASVLRLSADTKLHPTWSLLQKSPVATTLCAALALCGLYQVKAGASDVAVTGSATPAPTGGGSSVPATIGLHPTTIVSPGYAASASIPWDSSRQGGFVTCLAEDVRHNIWCGTEGTGLWRYNAALPEKERWRQYTTADGVGDNICYAVAVDRQGRVWAGSLNHSVSVFNGSAWKTYGIPDGLLGERVNSIAVSPVDGDVWIGTDAGITRYSITKDGWTNITRAEGLPGDSVTALAFTPSGTLIAGTQADGIAIGSPADHYKTWRTVRGPAGMSSSPGGDGLPSSQVNCLLVSRATGTIYVGTNFGLGRSEDGGKTFRYLRGAEWKDRANGLFHGPKPVETNTRGLSLLEDDVTALAEDATGRLYTGYRRAGLEVSDPQTGKRLAQSGDDFVTAILPWAGGNLLVGHYGNGLAQAKLNLTSSPVAPMAVQPIHEARFPTPAPTPTVAELDALRRRVESLQDKPLAAAYLGDDWATEGDWVNRYGAREAVLFAARAPMDEVIAADLSYSAHVSSGPDVLPGDTIRHWIHWLRTDDPRVLYDPIVGYRREAEADDHGETYNMTGHEGPGVFVKVKVPAGVHWLSLYFINPNGQAGDTRYRDYLIEIKPDSPKVEDVDSLPTLAHAGTGSFWPGVWKQFEVSGPGAFWVVVRRNGSYNTLLPGIFLDKLSGPPTPYETLQSPWLPGVQTDPAVAMAAVEKDLASAPPAARAAFALWKSADERTGREGEPELDRQARVMAYRALADGAAKGTWDSAAVQDLLSQWRRKLPLWSVRDRQRWMEEMAQARERLLKLNPQLAKLEN